MVDTGIPLGGPGIAGMDRESFGGIEFRSGDTLITSTTENVGENTDLAILSVVGRGADGNLTLAVFGGEGERAAGALTFTNVGVAAETITIGAEVYTLVAAPAAANEVLIGASATATAAALIAAINGGAGEGTLYGTGTVAHGFVTASAGGAGIVEVLANDPGEAGEAIATTETSTVASWAAATLTGGTGAGIKPIGVTTAPVVTGAGVSTTVDVYRTGMLNPDALVWDASFNTLQKRMRAFEGSASPGMFIQRNRFQAALP